MTGPEPYRKAEQLIDEAAEYTSDDPKARRTSCRRRGREERTAGGHSLNDHAPTWR